MCDQRRTLDLALSDHVEKSLHIALLSPAHVGVRIVAPLLLILGIVSTRTARTRDVEIEFLVEVSLAWDIQTNRADRCYHSLVSRNFTGQLNWFIAFGIGGNENG